MIEQPQRPPQARPEVYATLKPLWAVTAWLAWALGPGLLLVGIWMRADAMPEWLDLRSPLKWVSLLLTLAMVIGGGESRRTPEFWLLVVFWVGIGLGIPALILIMTPFIGIGALVAAFAFPIVGAARLGMYLWRRRVRPPAV